jgi:hypothetical protein
MILSFLLLLAAAVVAPAADIPPLASLPMDPSVALEKWEFTGATNAFSLALVDDEVLGRKVLEIKGTPDRKLKIRSCSLKSKAPVDGAYVVEAWVRFPQVSVDAKGVEIPRPSIKATLSCGTLSSSNAPAYVLEAGTGPDQFSWSGRWGTNVIARGGLVPFLKLADITPFSPESFRLETEAGIAAMPSPRKSWIPLRIEVGPRRVRTYYQGMLVTEQPSTGLPAGPVELAFLQGDVRVARLEVRPAETVASPFVPVPLDFRLNASGSVDVPALHRPGEEFQVHGIPFHLAGGTSTNDHVDVGASVFRHRFGTSYAAEIDPENHTQSPNLFEPARIRLSVPQRAYARAWILAGANDDPKRAPILTLRFYKPMTDWATDAAVTVPSFTAEAGGATARPVKVRTRDGKTANLWLIPIELNTAELVAGYRAPTLSIELTKEVKPNVGYPDPSNYSYQPAGLPSSVQLYGLTFEEAPAWAVGTSDVKGGVYTAPATPNWQVTVRNQSARDLTVVVQLAVSDPYGKTMPLEKKLTLKPGEEQTPSFPLKPTVYGLYTVRTTLSAGDWRQSREGTFLALPAHSRKATPLNSPWGVWTWNGTHDTNPNLEDCARQLQALGAINHFDLEEVIDRRNKTTRSLNDLRTRWGLGPTHYRLIPRNAPDWAAKNPLEPADYEAYKEEKGQKARALVEAHPDFQYVNCFAENAVSLRLTHGIPAWALGQPPFEYDAKETSRLRQMLNAANAAAEGVKKYAPGVKFLFGHGAANFAPPFFKEKNWNPDLFAGFGMDLPQFERMPERQPRATEPSLLYFLQKELKERGMEKKEVVHLESYYPPSHELALGLRGQANSMVRTAVLSMALGTTKFMHTWCLQDPANRWGSSHYSGSGLIGREPESHPKPAAAAFATMARVLDLARYDGWLETGSRSTFCLRFKDADRWVYATWTYQGSRPLEITADSPRARLVKIDESGNEFPLPLDQGKATVPLTPTVLWIVARDGEIKGALAGKPTYRDAPGERQVALDNFEQGRWTYDPKPYPRYASNNWDMVREPVRMSQEFVRSPERNSTVWRVSMTERPSGKPCVGFYGVFTPSKPIPIPGKARALGVHGNGQSQWFRVVYEVVDAKGEVWLSCGQKNAWNSDDIHSWSYFNHDGWRYMEFPLPASSPGDNYREKSCYSWGSSDDGIVDLPLTLTRIIVEMRTDIIYVNEMMPVKDLSIELDDLVAVYDDPENLTDKPIKLQAATRDTWRPARAPSILPNPIRKLLEDGAGPAPLIEKIFPPEVMDSGDQLYVKVKPVEGAQKYTVYVSAYPDGTGARAAPAKVEQDASLLFVRGLQPSIPMYLFASYTDKDGKESKPSKALKTVLRDEFPFK